MNLCAIAASTAAMFSYIKKSLSGESWKSGSDEISGEDNELESRPTTECPQDSEGDAELANDSKSYKRNRSRSGEDNVQDLSGSKSQKRKKLTRSRKLKNSASVSPIILDQKHESNPESDHDDVNGDTENEPTTPPLVALPENTPDWGIKLLEILQGTIKAEVRKVSATVSVVDEKTVKNVKDIKSVEKRCSQLERKNKALESKNVLLKEKLLDMEFKQRKCNLIFDGIVDAPGETDLECIERLRYVLKDNPGLDSKNFRIDRCHRLDGAFKPNQKRRVLCTFNWQYDLQCILKGRRRLARGVYVSEDLPEKWNDRRKVLRPLYNAARRSDKWKTKTRFSKDKLLIDGKPITVAPVCNVSEVNVYFDVASTCQRSDENKLIFFGSHSPFSNLYKTDMVVNNISYNSVEQYYQSAKASLFHDDATHYKIMNESNTYKIQCLGSKVKGFSDKKWSSSCKEVMTMGVCAKFLQNETLRNLLADSGDTLLAESSTNSYWGRGFIYTTNLR